MGVSRRHTRRIVAAYSREGAAALTRGHRGRRAPKATSERARSQVVHLTTTCYSETNHTYLSETAQRASGGCDRQDHVEAHTGWRRSEEPAPPPAAETPCPPAACAPRGDAYTGGRHSSPVVGRRSCIVLATSVRRRRYRHRDLRVRELPNDYFLLIRVMVQRYGIPIALYTDRHSAFKHVPGSGLEYDSTLSFRAMDELEVQINFALSPPGQGPGEANSWNPLGQVGDRASWAPAPHPSDRPPRGCARATF